MSAVIITKSAPFNNPTSGDDFDDFLEGGFRGSASQISVVVRNRLNFSLGTNTWLEAVEAADNTSDGLGPMADAIWNAKGALREAAVSNGVTGQLIHMDGARTLSGALVPAIGPAPTGVNVVGGDFNQRRLVGDGISKYFDTNYGNATDLRDSQHAFVGLVARGLNKSLIGAGVTEAGSLLIRDESTSWRIRSRQSGSITSPTSHGDIGLIGVSRTDAEGVDIYLMGSSTTAVLASQPPFVGNILVLARGTTASPSDFSSASINGWSLGAGLNQTQGEALRNAWDTATVAITAALA